jgi:hypothetical protein
MNLKKTVFYNCPSAFSKAEIPDHFSLLLLFSPDVFILKNDQLGEGCCIVFGGG